MSVQVLRVRFPALSIAISVERHCRQREDRPRVVVPNEVALARLAQRPRPVTELALGLAKLRK